MRIRRHSSSDQFPFVPLTATEAQVKVQLGEKAKGWMQGPRAASECIVCGDDDLASAASRFQHPIHITVITYEGCFMLQGVPAKHWREELKAESLQIISGSRGTSLRDKAEDLETITEYKKENCPILCLAHVFTYSCFKSCFMYYL